MVYSNDQNGLLLKKKRYLNGTTVNWDYGYTNKRLAYTYGPYVNSGDPYAVETDYGYDFAHDELTSKAVDPYGKNVVTHYAYDGAGNQTDVWTGTDAHAVTAYDGNGNPTSVTNPAGNATTFVYDAFNDKASQSGPSPLGTTTFDYDNQDRLTLTTLPDGHTVGTNYDIQGNPIQSVKEDGTTIVTTFDGLNRPTGVSQPIDATPSHNLTTSFGYNLRGERTSVTNPRNLTTYYGYDERGKMTIVTYPDNSTRKVGYDGVGNKMFTVNGRGQKTQLSYDSLDRPTGINYQDANTPDVTYAYAYGGKTNYDGRRLAMTDGTGTTVYDYDTAGRLKTQSGGLTGKTLTTTYYNNQDRRASLSDGTQTWSYFYDSGLRLENVNQTVGDPYPLDLTYRPSGAVDVQTDGNGSSTTYGYDSRGRTTSIGHKNGASPTITFGYRYGSDGNLDQCVEAQSGANTWTTAYVHDRADRLTSEVRTGGTGVNWSYQYAYDGNGNRTSVTRGGAVYAYGAYGNNDQFASGEGYAFSAYDYDGNPGTVQGPAGNTYLTYDEAGRVTSSSGITAATYRYDGDGRRVERVMGGVTTRFLYDGDTLVAELNGSNAVQLYRLPGVGFVRGGAQRYELENLQGSAAAVNDSSMAFTGFTEYDAYGFEVYTQGSDRGDLRFGSEHGYVNDDLSGMQLLGARYYVPALGRFLTQDPVGQEDGLNLYAYCGNSPLLRSDPKGTDTRNLTSDELGRMRTAADFLSRNGAPFAGEFYQLMLSYSPDTFQVDTEIGGAAWRFNKLYLGPTLFDRAFIPARVRGRARASMEATEYEDKAWFASILRHEFDHVEHDETAFLIGSQVGPVERRAWSVQINWLQRLLRGLTPGSARASRVNNLIDRAHEGRHQYE